MVLRGRRHFSWGEIRTRGAVFNAVGVQQPPQCCQVLCLGPPIVPFYPFLGEGSPTKTNYRKKATLIQTSVLEELVVVEVPFFQGDRTPDQQLGGGGYAEFNIIWLPRLQPTCKS